LASSKRRVIDLETKPGRKPGRVGAALIRY
jgi:hypothetical protein